MNIHSRLHTVEYSREYKFQQQREPVSLIAIKIVNDLIRLSPRHRAIRSIWCDVKPDSTREHITRALALALKRRDHNSMTAFSDAEIETIDRIWRSQPEAHPWTGWALLSGHMDMIWLFRTRANWRRFILRKLESGYCVESERCEAMERFETLAGLAQAVAAMPTLAAMSDATE